MALPFRITLMLAFILFGDEVFAADQNPRVGTDAGCTHADLDGALNAIRTQTGTHTIRINKGTYAVPNGMVYTPTVNQTAVFIEGGYDNCLLSSPADLDRIHEAGRVTLTVA